MTIEDVAEATGVSRQTVSRVVNGSPNVKQAVRERVEAAIDALGYVPNISARRMATGRSFIILAINDKQRTLENWRAGRGNDWVDQMLYGGISACERHGYHLVFELVDAEPAKAPTQLSAIIAAIRPDGIILTPPHSDNDALCTMLADHGIPYARVGRTGGAHSVDVAMDEAGAAAETTQRLIALGHRRFAYVAGSPDYGNSRLRIDGHLRAAAAGCATARTTIVNGYFQFDKARAELEPLLAQPPAMRPTAIIADNDEMAFAALHVAASLGLDVPAALSVVSFEDTPGVRFSVPPLSAIRQPTAEMIAKACEQLIAISATGTGHGSFTLPYVLAERATTGPAPADPDLSASDPTP